MFNWLRPKDYLEYLWVTHLLLIDWETIGSEFLTEPNDEENEFFDVDRVSDANPMAKDDLLNPAYISNIRAQLSPNAFRIYFILYGYYATLSGAYVTPVKPENVSPVLTAAQIVADYAKKFDSPS